MKKMLIEFIVFSLIGGFIWYTLNSVIKSDILSFFIASILNFIIGYVSAYLINRYSTNIDNPDKKETYEIKINHKLLA